MLAVRVHARFSYGRLGGGTRNYRVSGTESQPSTCAGFTPCRPIPDNPDCRSIQQCRYRTGFVITSVAVLMRFRAVTSLRLPLLDPPGFFLGANNRFEA